MDHLGNSLDNLHIGDVLITENLTVSGDLVVDDITLDEINCTSLVATGDISGATVDGLDLQLLEPLYSSSAESNVGAGRLNLNAASGILNTAYGYRSGEVLAAGTGNLLIGSSAGVNMSNGGLTDYNICIGSNAGFSSIATYDYSIAIGQSARISASNEMVLGAAAGATGISVLRPGLTNNTDLGLTGTRFKDIFAATFQAVGVGAVDSVLGQTDGTANSRAATFYNPTAVTTRKIFDARSDVGGVDTVNLGVFANGDLTTLGLVSSVGLTSTGLIEQSGLINSTNTTDASSATVGAIQTDGGLGVVKDIYCGATVNCAQLLTDGDFVSEIYRTNATAANGVFNIYSDFGGTKKAQMSFKANGEIRPAVNNQSDLGTSSFTFKDLHLGSDLNLAGDLNWTQAIQTYTPEITATPYTTSTALGEWYRMGKRIHWSAYVVWTGKGVTGTLANIFITVPVTPDTTGAVSASTIGTHEGITYSGMLTTHMVSSGAILMNSTSGTAIPANIKSGAGMATTGSIRISGWYTAAT